MEKQKTELNSNKNYLEADSQHPINHKENKIFQEKLQQIRELMIHNKLYSEKTRGLMKNYLLKKPKIRSKKLKRICLFLEENSILTYMIMSLLYLLSANKENVSLIRIELTIEKLREMSGDMKNMFSKQFSNLRSKVNSNYNSNDSNDSDKYDNYNLFEKAFIKYETIIKDNQALVQKMQSFIDNVLSCIFSSSTNFNVDENLNFFVDEINKLKAIKNINSEAIVIENEYLSLKYLNKESKENYFNSNLICEICLAKTNDAKIEHSLFEDLHRRKQKFEGLVNANNQTYQITIKFYEKQIAEVDEDLSKLEKELTDLNNVIIEKDNNKPWVSQPENILNLNFFNKLKQKIRIYESFVKDISTFENLNSLKIFEYQTSLEKEIELQSKHSKLEIELTKALENNKLLMLQLKDKSEKVELINNLNEDLNKKLNDLRKEIEYLMNSDKESKSQDILQEKVKEHNYKVCEEIKHYYEVNQSPNNNKNGELNNYLNISHIYAKNFLEKSYCSFSKEAGDIVKNTNIYNNNNLYNTNNNLNSDKARDINFVSTNTHTHFDNHTKECSGKVYQEYVNKFSNEKIIYSNNNINNKVPYTTNANSEQQNKLNNEKLSNQFYSDDCLENNFNEKNSSDEDYWGNRNLLSEEAQLLLNEIKIYKKLIKEKDEIINSLERKVMNLREDIQSFTQRKFTSRDLFINFEPIRIKE